MTSPVSAIEAIEKALDEFDREVQEQLSSESERADLWEELDVNASDLREVLAVARQAEALQRENAEKDARIAALEAGIRPFSKYAGVVFERNFNSSDPVDTMTATDGAVSTLYARDFFSARALLGGSEHAE